MPVRYEKSQAVMAENIGSYISIATECVTQQLCLQRLFETAFLIADIQAWLEDETDKQKHSFFQFRFDSLFVSVPDSPVIRRTPLKRRDLPLSLGWNKSNASTFSPGFCRDITPKKRSVCPLGATQAAQEKHHKQVFFQNEKQNKIK